MKIHVLTNKGPSTEAGSIGLVRIDSNTYTTGSWVISEEVAKNLVGNTVCLHELQKERSYFGGKIIAVEEVESDTSRRWKLTFSPTKDGRDQIYRKWGARAAVAIEQ